MIQSINPFLNFNGDAAEAIELYRSAVGATINAIMRWSDMPGDNPPPPGLAEKIMYARLDIGGGAIELSDVPPGVGEATAGSNTHVALHLDDPKELDRCVAALADGGQIEMGPEDMFWGARYAKVRDRFGVSWTFNCQLGDPGLHS